MDKLKICSKYKNEKLPKNFHEKSASEDGLHPHLKSVENNKTQKNT